MRASLPVFMVQKDQGYELAHTTIEPIHQMSRLVIHEPSAAIVPVLLLLYVFGV